MWRRSGFRDARGDVTLTATNSTISGNEVADAGGGITAISGSTLDLTHVTVAQNTASSGGGIDAPTNTVVTAQCSIVSGNTGADCAGAIVSAGHNLDSDGSWTFAETTDQTLDQGLTFWVEVTEAITWTSSHRSRSRLARPRRDQRRSRWTHAIVAALVPGEPSA